jgi:UDP-N-acetylglucosamine 2-epimerase (non-hydrolysing)
VARALGERGIAPSLILTGQHADLEPAAFDLAGFPVMRLDCPGEEDPHVHVGKVTAALLPRLRPRPDLLVVQGDTSSALGAALAAFTAGIPVAHVEAGLRTHDPLLPWPEEEYRTAIDARADLLFAPTAIAAANLRAERVPGEIHVTGNTSIDALLAVETTLPPPCFRKPPTPRILVTCHRRENWGKGLASVAVAMAEIASAGDAAIEVILPPNPHVARTLRTLLGHGEAIALIEPCGHRQLVARMLEADLVLSDSGGIQEEAPALGTPLLVLRDKTERPEGLASGNARMVGTATDAIVREVRALLGDPLARAAMARRSFPYGDGRAGPRIASIICDRLGAREASAQRAARFLR